MANPFAQGEVVAEIWICLIRDVVSTSDQCNLSQVTYLLVHEGYERHRTTITGQQRREDENLWVLILNCYHFYLGKIWKRTPEAIAGAKEFLFIAMPSDSQRLGISPLTVTTKPMASKLRILLKGMKRSLSLTRSSWLCPQATLLQQLTDFLPAVLWEQQ